MKNIQILVFLWCLLMPVMGWAQSGRIYFTTGDNFLSNVNIDGTNLLEIGTGSTKPFDIFINDAEQKIYWVDDNSSQIHRANIDGSNPEIFRKFRTKELGRPIAFAFDSNAGKLYWVVDSYPNYKIKKSNLDGSSIEELVSLANTSGLRVVLDINAGKMYFSTYSAIYRANLDGSNLQTIAGNIIGGGGLALDLNANKVYWTEIGLIRKANLDGSNAETIITSSFINDNYNTLALDVNAGKIYFGNSASIYRGDLNGTNIVQLLSQSNTFFWSILFNTSAT